MERRRRRARRVGLIQSLERFLAASPGRRKLVRRGGDLCAAAFAEPIWAAVAAAVRRFPCAPDPVTGRRAGVSGFGIWAACCRQHGRSLSGRRGRKTRLPTARRVHRLHASAVAAGSARTCRNRSLLTVAPAVASVAVSAVDSAVRTRPPSAPPPILRWPAQRTIAAGGFSSGPTRGVHARIHDARRRRVRPR